MNRLARTAGAVSVAAVAILGLSGCGPSEPIATVTIVPGVSPGTSPGTSALPCVRDPGMTDAQALARMANPTTGEVWFDAPVEIAAPAWAASDEYLGQEWVVWYEIGTRGDRTILTVGFDAGQYIVERDALGTYSWIEYPSAHNDPSFPNEDSTLAAIAVDAETCYDSLTFPDTFVLPGGEPLTWYGPDFGGVGTPGMGAGDPLPTGEVAATIGGFDIRRVEEPQTWIWSDPYPTAVEPAGLTYTALYYVLVTPYGMSIPLFYSPVGEFASVAWSVPTTIADDGDRVYVADLMDSICGERPHDQETIVTGLADAEWLPGGTTVGGEPVYVPSASNPLVEPLYAAYVGARESWGEPTVSLDEFRAAPGLIGYRSVDTGELLVYLNGAYSGRAWC